MSETLEKTAKEARGKELKETAEKLGVDLILLFGSQATGRTHKNSDIDVAYSSTEDFNLEKEYEFLRNMVQIFQRKENDIEIVNLKMASPTLMRAIARDGILLYEKEEGLFLKWKLYAIKIWMETSWLRRLRDQKLLKWTLPQT